MFCKELITFSCVNVRFWICPFVKSLKSKQGKSCRFTRCALRWWQIWSLFSSYRSFIQRILEKSVNKVMNYTFVQQFYILVNAPCMCMWQLVIRNERAGWPKRPDQNVLCLHWIIPAIFLILWYAKQISQELDKPLSKIWWRCLIYLSKMNMLSPIREDTSTY